MTTKAGILARPWSALLLCLIHCASLSCNAAFLHAPTTAQSRKQHLLLSLHKQRRHGGTAAAATSGDGMDSMRRMLEDSWKSGSMGTIPTSPEGAAEAAAASIASALSRNRNLLLVDILLPTYDVREGPRLYDEVLATEFCIKLADCLKAQSLVQKSLILVKDEKARTTAARVFDARGRRRSQEEQDLWEENSEEDTDGNIVASDDDIEGKTGDNDVDSFRQQLLSSWEAPSVEGAESAPIDADETVSSDSKAVDPLTQPSGLSPPTKQKVIAEPADNSYRLWSLLGDAVISSGADMFGDVIEAVDRNAYLMDGNEFGEGDEEGALILLSPHSREDVIAVRRVVARYGMSKTIVLVNSKLNPMPKELVTADTVYSILPLVAKAVGDDTEKDGPPPKIVLMRRYPKDWEVYMDGTGEGFELVGSISSKEAGQSGPSMEWVADQVKNYMQVRQNERNA